MENNISSDVWSASGWIASYTRGLLTLNNGILRFNTDKGEEFAAPLAALQNIKWPRLQMGLGVHFEVNGKKYKFTFMEPASERMVDPGGFTDFGRIANGFSAIKAMSHIKDYKAVAKQWREIIGG